MNFRRDKRYNKEIDNKIVCEKAKDKRQETKARNKK